LRHGRRGASLPGRAELQRARHPTFSNPADLGDQVNVLQDQACRVFLINLTFAIMLGLYCFKAVRRLSIAFRVGYLCSLTGFLSNWMVVSVNGDQMPVLDYRGFFPRGTPWR